MQLGADHVGKPQLECLLHVIFHVVHRLAEHAVNQIDADPVDVDFPRLIDGFHTLIGRVHAPAGGDDFVIEGLGAEADFAETKIF
ncbi:hypothetical protein D3C79_858160 [compost metagenome]